MIPNSQIQYNSNGFLEEIQHNVKLPDWFSDKLITDFFKYEEEALQQTLGRKRIGYKRNRYCFL